MKKEPVYKENIDAETPMSLHDDLIRVDWYNAGEGYCGDYNPDNPEDENLLRFDVYVNETKDGNPDNWAEVEDASYCTLVPADTDKKVLKEKLGVIFRAYREEIDDYPILFSVKKLGERLSWITA